ncbi:hypothetical protein SORBI_3003G293450 [Sorghum bicolor]|uniref:Uncharacterized protein n=1 Tax=Sorghum bicolor TaxID=4558 RepID=A0A1W0VZF3_SORBI|nr:hypothetical protein SORBI_3003G293450 [Sorghum bicolor]
MKLKFRLMISCVASGPRISNQDEPCQIRN